MLISIASILAAMIIIQSGASLAKQLFPVVGPAGTTTLRLIFSALILLIAFRPWRKISSGLNWPFLFLYGTSLGAMNLLFYLAIERIPLGIGVALEFTGPLAVALLSSKRAKDLIWVACAVVGIILLLPLTEASQNLDLLGIVLALAAGACWAGYIIFGQRASHGIDGGTAVSIGMVFAALVACPMGFAVAGEKLFSLNILPMGLAVALLSSALPYSLEMKALKNLPTQTFSILMSLEPVFAALSGLIFLKERLSITQVLAICFVIVASLGSSLSNRKSESHT